MEETVYNPLEECKKLAQKIADQALTNAGYKTAAEFAALLLAREEAVASEEGAEAEAEAWPIEEGVVLPAVLP